MPDHKELPEEDLIWSNPSWKIRLKFCMELQLLLSDDDWILTLLFTCKTLLLLAMVLKKINFKKMILVIPEIHSLLSAILLQLPEEGWLNHSSSPGKTITLKDSSLLEAGLGNRQCYTGKGISRTCFEWPLRRIKFKAYNHFDQKIRGVLMKTFIIAHTWMQLRKTPFCLLWLKLLKSIPKKLFWPELRESLKKSRKKDHAR